MLIHYIKTAFKTAWQNNKVTAINLIGLSTALCTCFFILLYIRFELSYDTYNKKADNIYRLVTDVQTPAGTDYRGTSAPMAPAIQIEFPEVKAATRVFLDYVLLQKNDKNFNEENIAYADSSIFTIFTLPLVSGDYKKVFAAPFNIVISQTAAYKYFGNENPMGKTLLVDGKLPAVITGVMKDMPLNSQFRADMLFSMSTLLKVFKPNRATDWGLFGFYTYLLLPDKYNANLLSAKLPAFIKQHIDANLHYTLQLEPLTSVYLHGKPRGWRTGSAVTGDINTVYIFALVALFVLGIACINFINLSVASSLKQAKQIGVRKVMGASKMQLAVQFFTNAILQGIIAFLLAIILCILFLPLFNSIIARPISASIFDEPSTILLMFAVAIVTSAIAGIYPAIYLSSLKPAIVIKPRFATGTKGSLLRKTLVAFQFAVSTIFIISTIVVQAQLHYMQNTQLGFSKEHKLAVDFHFDYRVWQPRETVKQLLTNVPGVTGASFSSCIPGRANIKLPVTIENKQGSDENEEFDAWSFDGSFLNQYKIAVVAGRGFSKNTASDSLDAMLINEAAVKSLGYSTPADVIGKRFVQEGVQGTIIGVIKDFHFHSMREEVQPLTMRIVPWRFTFVTLDITSQNLTSTISTLEKVWQQIAPGLPFSYSFTDEAFDAQYKAEERFGKLFMCFAIIAIVISCLGLLALSYFSIIQRTKELGIRKVLGASNSGIAGLLAKSFLQPVFMSFIVAMPLSWLAMHAWLQGYAYRVTIGVWMFLLAGVAAVFISGVTICFHTIKAANANPIKSLKTE